MSSSVADLSDKWCILRTSGRHTMALAESLAADGFEVWTPIEMRRIRISRANVKRDVRLPIMPTYVFARAIHLVDLLELAKLPVKPRRVPQERNAEGRLVNRPNHRDFSVVHAFGRIPLVADAALHQLRKIEAKRTPMPKAEKALPKGLRVRVEGGSFGGMRGVVERSDRGTSLVCFNGRFIVKIATSLLNIDEIQGCLNVAQRAA